MIRHLLFSLSAIHLTPKHRHHIHHRDKQPKKKRIMESVASPLPPTLNEKHLNIRKSYSQLWEFVWMMVADLRIGSLTKLVQLIWVIDITPTARSGSPVPTRKPKPLTSHAFLPFFPASVHISYHPLFHTPQIWWNFGAFKSMKLWCNLLLRIHKIT